MQTSVDRRTVLRGGLVGLVIGGGLLALALFFLIRGFDAPQQVVGVFVPLAVSLVSLGLGVAAVIPLRLGDDHTRSPAAIATAFRLLAGLGILITALGVVRGALPWIAFGLLPLFACTALLKTASRFARHAHEHAPTAG